MKIIKNYDNYVSDLLLESIKDGKDLHFSKEFLSLLGKIDHPISKKLKGSHEKQNDNSTLIDLDNSETDKISWQEPGRGRQVVKVGRLISKLFGDEFPTSGRNKNDIESFINIFKAFRERESVNFKLVKGNDIVKYYNRDTYKKNSGPLGMSDMSYSDVSDYIKFYAKNDNIVSLLVLFNDENEVIGRALVWKLSEPKGRYFMDRIYTSSPSSIELFIEYAKENGWLHLEKQTFTDVKITDSKTGNSEFMTLVVNNVKSNKHYPYMDTFKFFLVDDGKLTNDIDDADETKRIYSLTSTEGGYESLWEDEED